jgi:hypothetical protein
MTTYNAPDKKSCRNLAAKYDRTDGSRFGHYSRESVAAANHATGGQEHE